MAKMAAAIHVKAAGTHGLDRGRMHFPQSATGPQKLEARVEGAVQGIINRLLVCAWTTEHGSACTIGGVAIDAALKIKSDHVSTLGWTPPTGSIRIVIGPFAASGP